MTDLLPCPFCGAPVFFMPYKRDGLKIECKPCVISYAQRTIRFDLNWLEEKMAAHWNRRATPADHISQARDAVIVPVELLRDLIDDVQDYSVSRTFKDSEVRWRADLLERSYKLYCPHDMKSAPPEKPAGDVSDI